jgi:hypothetical protein
MTSHDDEVIAVVPDPMPSTDSTSHVDNVISFVIDMPLHLLIHIPWFLRTKSPKEDIYTSEEPLCHIFAIVLILHNNNILMPEFRFTTPKTWALKFIINGDKAVICHSPRRAKESNTITKRSKNEIKKPVSSSGAPRMRCRLILQCCERLQHKMPPPLLTERRLFLESDVVL